jgi:hypothetical protein
MVGAKGRDAHEPEEVLRRGAEAGPHDEAAVLGATGPVALRIEGDWHRHEASGEPAHLRDEMREQVDGPHRGVAGDQRRPHGIELEPLRSDGDPDARGFDIWEVAAGQ